MERHLVQTLWFLLWIHLNLTFLYSLLTRPQPLYVQLVAPLQCLRCFHETKDSRVFFTPPPQLLRIRFIIFHATESDVNQKLGKTHTGYCCLAWSSAGFGTCSSADFAEMARGQMWLPPPPTLLPALNCSRAEMIDTGPVHGQWKHALPSLHTVAARHWLKDVLLQTASRATTNISRSEALRETEEIRQ